MTSMKGRYGSLAANRGWLLSPTVILATGQLECKRLVTSNANEFSQGVNAQGAPDYPAAHHDVNIPAMILASRRAW